MIEHEILSFVSEENIKLEMNLYRAKDNRKNITILYLHGGGLLYGVRDDLPELYINKFLISGYDFLSMDYPLAPESKLGTILETTYEEILYFMENHQNLFGLESNEYVLFGRSAGAYLCFMMCQKLIDNNNLLPKAIISLYGYSGLDEISFNTPSRHYNKLARVSDESIEKIISHSPVTYGPMSARFSLYIKARQEGTWVRFLCGKENPAKYSLDTEKLKNFPTAILAAATLDPDVPYKMSKTLSKLIPNSQLITIYEDTHDFDRDINKESGRLTYGEILKWLEEKIK